jgi:hypothetical protein
MQKKNKKNPGIKLASIPGFFLNDKQKEPCQGSFYDAEKGI